MKMCVQYFEGSSLEFCLFKTGSQHAVLGGSELATEAGHPLNFGD